MSRDVTEIAERSELIRWRLKEHLTPTQYRRVALRHGFNGQEPMTYAEVADAEGVDESNAYRAIQTGLERLEERAWRDGHLLLLWLSIW